MQFSRKLAYSGGSLGSGLLSQAFNTYILFFYLDYLKAPALAIGSVMTAYGIWNAINDPLFGLISDRTQTRWGRRIPYIAFGTLPLMIAFALLWMPPFTSQQPHLLVAYFALMTFLWDGLYTLVILNWTALFPEMFPSLAERSQVSALRQMFSIIGMIGGIALVPMIRGAIGWANMGILFAVISGISLYVALAGSREDPDKLSKEKPIGLVESVTRTFTTPSFPYYVIANFLIQLAFTILTAVLPFYIKYVLHLNDNQSTALLGTVLVVAFLAMPAWSVITARKGGRTAMLIGLVTFGVLLWGFWFAHSFASGMMAGALAGLGLASLMMLLDVLLADIIDEDEVRTGQRREGAFFGIQAFVIRLGISVESLLVTSLLHSAGYVSRAAHATSGCHPGSEAIVVGHPRPLARHRLGLCLVLPAAWGEAGPGAGRSDGQAPGGESGSQLRGRAARWLRAIVPAASESAGDEYASVALPVVLYYSTLCWRRKSETSSAVGREGCAPARVTERAATAQA
ncbi:MAG: MFS transporter [Limnochordaceae bacterium]|nr:MFS transporter [Limnochordaceae bacterium]